MKDMLGTEVVVGDTVVFADYIYVNCEATLNIGVVVDSNDDGGVVVEDRNSDIHVLSSEEFAYYTTIKDLT